MNHDTFVFNVKNIIDKIDVSFSCVTSTSGLLTKTIQPDGKGGIDKEPAAQMTGGIAETITVTEHPKGATDDRVNGATKSGSFSLLDGIHYWSFFALFSPVVFVPWGQFFGER